MKQPVATPIFVRDIETAKELLATVTKDIAVNIFVLNHKEAVAVLDQMAERIIVQPVKRFGEEKIVYTDEPDKVSNEDRQKYIKDLAGQIFTAKRQNIEVSIEVTSEGKFRNIETNEVFDAPSTAYFRGWEGKISGAGTINGWGGAKNKHGRSIDDEIKKSMSNPLRPTRVSKENREKYMPQLAGQIFTGVRKGVTLVVEIQPNGHFKRVSPPSKNIYDNLSSACTSDGFRMDGWRYLKNGQGQTIDDIIKTLIK